MRILLFWALNIQLCAAYFHVANAKGIMPSETRIVAKDMYLFRASFEENNALVFFCN